MRGSQATAARPSIPYDDPVALARLVCPHLTIDGGSGRFTRPSRAHRCGAVEPPTVLSTEFQRDVCLGTGHSMCPVFQAARAARSEAIPVIGVDWAPTRPIVRTAPIVMDRPLPGPIAMLLAGRGRMLQVGLLAVLAIVVLVLVLSRGPGSTGLGSGATGSPGTATAGAPGVSAVPSSGTSATEAPSDGPTTEPTGGPAASPASSPARPATYRVRPGDTLGAIARKFGVTVAAIQKLNKIKDPRKIKVGQTLRLP